MYKHTCLSPLRKMLTLLIRSHCKICPLPTSTISQVCIAGNRCQWANFTMGPNEQNHYFAELRQNVCLYIYTRLSVPKMFAKFGYQTRTSRDKKDEKMVSQAWFRQTVVDYGRLLTLANVCMYVCMDVRSYV